MKQLIFFNKAKKLVLNSCKKLKTEMISIKNSLFRITAKNLFSKLTVPNYNNSAKDGFAIKSWATKNASLKNPVYLKIIGTSSSGKKSKFHKKYDKKFSCIKIMTGAPLPKNFDSVIEKELVIKKNGFIKIIKPIKKYSNVRFKGNQLEKNEFLFPKGTRLQPQHIGILISAGINQILTYKIPTVGIITTGNEIVNIDKKPKFGQVKNSNSYVLQSLLQKYNFNFINYGLVKDNFNKIKSVVLKAIKDCDVILISGGISHGEYDLVKPVLKNVGTKSIFWEIRCRPGKPLFFGTKIFNKKKKYIFGIPGNPVANFVQFEVLIKPFLLKLSGRKDFDNKNIFFAFLTKSIKKEPQFKYFLRGKYFVKKNIFFVTPLQNQDSSILKSVVKANCLIILNEQDVELKKGNIVKILLLN